MKSYITFDKFSYQSIDDVVELSSPSCFYSIMEIKAAYRAVPIYPPHLVLQGLDGVLERVNRNSTQIAFCVLVLGMLQPSSTAFPLPLPAQCAEKVSI